VTNVRPKQIAAPRWPWKNRIMNGLPTVVEREPHPWMPELVSCFDWTEFEEQEIPIPLEGTCSRDMKSIFTTALRMYGYEELYRQLKAGNNVFEMIGAEMLRWTWRLGTCRHIQYYVIGDDIAHKTNLIFPPDMLRQLIHQYNWFTLKGHEMIFHSDGFIEPIWDALKEVFDYFLIQKDLNPNITGDNIFDNGSSTMEWGSYKTKEMAGG